jgi:hypothetical protein
MAAISSSVGSSNTPGAACGLARGVRGRGLRGEGKSQWRRGDVAAAGGAVFEQFGELDDEHDAAGDAAEDGAEIKGAEGDGEEGESRGAGALEEPVLQVAAINEERGQQVDDAPDATAALPRRLGGRRERGRVVGRPQERNKNTNCRRLSRAFCAPMCGWAKGVPGSRAAKAAVGAGARPAAAGSGRFFRR